MHARNCRDETPLHLLAMSGAFEAGPAVAHVLECGGRIGARDERGDTPLHKAVTCGELGRACQLVSAGGSLVTPNHAGHCALELVAWQGGARVAERLREAIVTPPLWVPDGTVSGCMACRAPFSARMRRVHHCRHCGAAVCAACSADKLPIPKFNVAKPVRCCRACYVVLSALPSASLRLAPAPAGAPAARHMQAAVPPLPLLSAAMLLGEAEAEAPRPTADTDTTCSPDPSTQDPSSRRESFS